MRALAISERMLILRTGLNDRLGSTDDIVKERGWGWVGGGGGGDGGAVCEEGVGKSTLEWMLWLVNYRKRENRNKKKRR